LFSILALLFRNCIGHFLKDAIFLRGLALLFRNCIGHFLKDAIFLRGIPEIANYRPVDGASLLIKEFVPGGDRAEGGVLPRRVEKLVEVG
jgi:hypothetical protein